MWLRWTSTRTRSLWPSPSISSPHLLPAPFFLLSTGRVFFFLQVGFILGMLKQYCPWERAEQDEIRKELEVFDDLGLLGIPLHEYLPCAFHSSWFPCPHVHNHWYSKEQQPGLILHVCTSYSSLQLFCWTKWWLMLLNVGIIHDIVYHWGISALKYFSIKKKIRL